MWNSEKQVLRSLVDQGWEVFRGGWPDFLCMRAGSDGNEILAVEVKGLEGVKPNQRRMHEILRLIGIPTVIVPARTGRTRVIVNLPDGQLASLASLSGTTGIPKQELARRAIDAYLKNYKAA